MTKYLPILSAFFLFGFVTESNAYYEGDAVNKVHFGLEVDYVAFWRADLTHLRMLYINKPHSIIPQYPVHQSIELPFSSGLRATAEITPWPFMTLEALYLGPLHWATNKLYESNASFFTPTDPYPTNDYTQGSNFAFKYKSKFNTGELNYWENITNRMTDYFSLSLLAGLKYIDYRDKFFITFVKGNNKDTYNTKIINRFIGAQLGFDFESNMTSYFSLGCIGKFGAYADLISKHVKLLDNNNLTTVYDGTHHRVAPAYTLEISPSMYFRFAPGYIRLGYEYLMILHPAISPAQLNDNKSINHITRKRHTNMQSLQAGIGFNW